MNALLQYKPRGIWAYPSIYKIYARNVTIVSEAAGSISRRQQFRSIEPNPKILERLDKVRLGFLSKRRNRVKVARKFGELERDLRQDEQISMVKETDPYPFNEPGKELFQMREFDAKSLKALRSLPQVALIGRSNVGKSTLLNALVKFDASFVQKAVTSDRPGETRDLKFYKLGKRVRSPKPILGKLNETVKDTSTTTTATTSSTVKGASALVLVDMPGYGFSFMNEQEKQRCFQLSINYLLYSQLLPARSLRRVLLVLDGRHGIKTADKEFFKSLYQQYQELCNKPELLTSLYNQFALLENKEKTQQDTQMPSSSPSHSKHHEAPLTAFPKKLSWQLQIVLTKCDLVERMELCRRIMQIQEEMATLLPPRLIGNLPVIAVSGMEKQGVIELEKDLASLVPVKPVQVIEAVSNEEEEGLQQGKVNRWVEDMKGKDHTRRDDRGGFQKQERGRYANDRSRREKVSEDEDLMLQGNHGERASAPYQRDQNTPTRRGFAEKGDRYNRDRSRENSSERKGSRQDDRRPYSPRREDGEKSSFRDNRRSSDSTERSGSRERTHTVRRSDKPYERKEPSEQIDGRPVNTRRDYDGKSSFTANRRNSDRSESRERPRSNDKPYRTNDSSEQRGGSRQDDRRPYARREDGDGVVRNRRTYREYRRSIERGEGDSSGLTPQSNDKISGDGNANFDGVVRNRKTYRAYRRSIERGERSENSSEQLTPQSNDKSSREGNNAYQKNEKREYKEEKKSTTAMSKERGDREVKHPHRPAVSEKWSRKQSSRQENTQQPTNKHFNKDTQRSPPKERQGGERTEKKQRETVHPETLFDDDEIMDKPPSMNAKDFTKNDRGGDSGDRKGGRRQGGVGRVSRRILIRQPSPNDD